MNQRRAPNDRCHGLSAVRSGKPCLSPHRAPSAPSRASGLQPQASSLPPTSLSPAFTLLELIVVVILITVLTGLIAPRLLDSAHRRAESEAADVARLLSAAAQKDALTPRTLAIAYDDEERLLELLAQHYVAERATWIPDPLVEPALLEHTEIVAATADGAALDTRNWLVAFPPAHARPAISLLVYAEQAARGWQIDLLPEGSSATVTATGTNRTLTPVTSGAVDLDDAGRGSEAW